MIRLLPFLADADPANPMTAPLHLPDSRLYEILSLFGALLLSVIVATVWAIVYAKRRNKASRHRHHHRPQPALTTKPVEAGDSQSRHKRRRQRRPHRPLGTTLAQTGGLPPIRDHNTPPPGP